MAAKLQSNARTFMVEKLKSTTICKGLRVAYKPYPKLVLMRGTNENASGVMSIFTSTVWGPAASDAYIGR
jgi:hypothetical protein